MPDPEPATPSPQPAAAGAPDVDAANLRASGRSGPDPVWTTERAGRAQRAERADAQSGPASEEGSQGLEGPTGREQDNTEDPREWWDDPRMPWKGKPGRRDIACWAAFSLTGVYALVLLPLRPVLLGANPYLLAGLGGSRVSAVTIGALAATGVGFWPLGLLLGTFGAVKFDWIYWWAGRLWGRGMLEMASGRSPRAARNAARAERLAQRFGVAAIALGYVIPFLPGAIVYATVAAAGMSLRRFLVVDVLSAAVTRGLLIWLGWSIGEPAVHVLEVIAQYSWYLSIALLVGVVVTTVRQSRRRASKV